MTDCSICIETLSKGGFKLRCGHSFHNKCITTWLLTRDTCPVCRKCIINNEKNDISQTFIFMNKYNIPIHIIENIQNDSIYEVDAFFEENDIIIRNKQHTIYMYTRYKTNGHSYECRFSIEIILVKDMYIIIVKIRHLYLFKKRIKNVIDRYIFKNKTKRYIL